MADHLKMDPARIARLQDPQRLQTVDPARIWHCVSVSPSAVIADIGCGAGYVALPFAAHFPEATVYACDVLSGMLDLVDEAAQTRALDNLKGILMTGVDTGLSAHTVDLVTMLQVHHELDDPEAVLGECRRILKKGGHLVIVDWKHPDDGGPESPGRRVSASEIRLQLERTGFSEVRSHPVYTLHNLITAQPGTDKPD